MTERRGGDNRRVLVAGATGYLGGYVARAFRERGYWVRVLARPGSRHRLPHGDWGEVFLGEATRDDSLAGVCDGVSVVFSSIGLRTFAPHPTIWEVDCQANLNLVNRAKEAGVEHFVFVSVLRGDEIRARVPVAEARERVVDAVRRSGMTWTVLRPTGYFNDMADLFELVRRLGVYAMVGGGDARINPIHGADLADVAVASAEEPEYRNTSRGLGGPDIYTFRGIGELAFATVRRRPRMVSVPPSLVGISAKMVRPFSLNASAMLEALGLLFQVDAVGTPVGSRHLKDFFAELLALSGGKSQGSIPA